MYDDHVKSQESERTFFDKETHLKDLSLYQTSEGQIVNYQGAQILGNYFQFRVNRGKLSSRATLLKNGHAII